MAADILYLLVALAIIDSFTFISAHKIGSSGVSSSGNS